MTTGTARRPERRLSALPSKRTPDQSFRIQPEHVFKGLVLVMLGLIAHAVAKPSALDRCIRSRYQQVLESHQLTDQQITEAIRTSEFNKATNFCSGGTGRMNWGN